MAESPRWRWERALRDSDLTPPARLVALTVATYVDNGGATPPARSPSLTALATATGLDRSTITRKLDELETSGWLHRDRPSPARARAGDHTCYQLADPGRTLHLVVGAHSTQELGADSDQQTAEVGAEDRTPGRTVHPYAEREKDAMQIDSATAAARHRSTSPAGALANAVFEALPDHLAGQLSRRTLEQVTEQLADTWTPDQLWNAVSSQSWANALGPGAVIGWLRHRAGKIPPQAAGRRSDPRPRCTAPDCANGWIGEDGQGRPIPCPTCRPDVVARQAARNGSKRAPAAGELLFVDKSGVST